MNRRSFFKTIALTAASAPFWGMKLKAKTFQSELDDLYSYIESTKIYTPDGIVPFKLFPFQKEILKHIHENDRVFIIKARQIGMTSLLAGYTNWTFKKKKLQLTYLAPSTYSANDFYNRTTRSKPLEIAKDDEYRLVMMDEMNFDNDVYHGIPLICDYMAMFDEFVFGSDVWKVPPHPAGGKVIVAGSIDNYGIMEDAFGLAYARKWKLLCYPATRCQPLWNDDRIQRYKRNVEKKYWKNELILV